jgi:hypothetical protein
MTEPEPDDDADRSATDVPYHEITVPSPKETLDTEFGVFEETYEGVDLNAYERRAVLLDRILDAGHPRALDATQEDLADEFGVSQSTISDDVQILLEWMGDNLTRDSFALMDMVYRSSVRNLMEDGEYRDAARTVSDWIETLADIGAVDRVPDRVDLAVSRDDHETESYEIITDDDADNALVDDETDDA